MESAWRRAPVPEIAGRPTRSTLTPIAAKNSDARRPSPSQTSLRTSPGQLSAPSRTADCELNPHGPSPDLTCGFTPLVGVQIGVGGPTPHRTTPPNPPPPRSSVGSSPHERTSGRKSGTSSLAIPVAKRPLEPENVPRIPERHRIGRGREAQRSRARQNRRALVTQHARANRTSRRPSHIRRQSARSHAQAVNAVPSAGDNRPRAIDSRDHGRSPTTFEPACSATRGSRSGPWGPKCTGSKGVELQITAR